MITCISVHLVILCFLLLYFCSIFVRVIKTMSAAPSPRAHMLHNHTNATNPNACGGATNASSADFWIGVTSSLLGSVVLNLGLNIQKLAFVRNSKVAPEERKPVYKNCLWLFGFLVFAIGNAGDAVGLTFTAQSIITPIGAIALVSNLFFARLLIGEKIGCKTSVAIVFIICGVVSIVVSGNTNCSSVTLDTLKLKFLQPGFLIFAVFHLGTLFGLLFYTCAKEKKMYEIDTTTKRKVYVGLENFTPSEKSRLRLAMPLLGSCFAAWTVLLSKSVGELVKVSGRSGDSQFIYWETYVILGGFIVSMPCQIMYINKGLAHFESLYIIPIFYSTWLIGSIMMGALFWNEFDGFEVWQYVVFSAGVLCVMIGVLLLQQREIISTDEHGIEGMQGIAPNGPSDKKQPTLKAVDTAIDEVMNRRPTFFTRTAAKIVSQEVLNGRTSRGNSAASVTVGNESKKDGTEVQVEMVELG